MRNCSKRFPSSSLFESARESGKGALEMSPPRLRAVSIAGLFCLLIFTLSVACKDQDASTQPVAEDSPSPAAPRIDAGRAFEDVKKMVELGPGHPAPSLKRNSRSSSKANSRVTALKLLATSSTAIHHTARSRW